VRLVEDPSLRSGHQPGRFFSQNTCHSKKRDLVIFRYRKNISMILKKE
jgi:hypothetical protein